MAKLKRQLNHDVNAGESLPEKFSRVDDLDLYRAGVERVLANKEPPKEVPYTHLEAGNIVYLNDKFQEVLYVSENGKTIWFEEAKMFPHSTQGLLRAPRWFEASWYKAKQECNGQ